MASAMEALVLYPATHKTAVVDVPKPMPGPGEVLVRIHAVALNPVDSIYVTHPLATQKQRVLGTDFAGVVEAVGPSPIPNSPAVGTRVAGFVQGACSVNELPGAFAQYVALPADLVWTVPKAMSLESASTISMCGLTAAQGVFARLRLPAPFPVPDVHKAKTTTNADPVNILVYAASTSLGMYIAQCLRASEKASGRKIRMIGTASQSKHALLNAPPYSYDAVIDYRHKDWPKMVREATTGGNGVQYAIDCISEGATVSGVESTFEASIQGEGHFATFRGPGGAGGGYDVGSLKVKPTYGAVWEGQGVEVDYGGEANPA